MRKGWVGGAVAKHYGLTDEEAGSAGPRLITAHPLEGPQ